MARKKSRNLDLKKWVNTHGTDFVIKVRNGKPYISRKPKRDPERKKSPGEQRQVNLFKLAVKYAKEVLEDPEKQQPYLAESEQSGRSIYHIAISDYLNKNKQVDESEQLEYEDMVVEEVGKHLFLKIEFAEHKAFKKMEVSLLELDQTLVENGLAEAATVTQWWYLIQNPDVTGLPFRVRVRATNNEGRSYDAERVIV